ncbi:MAG: hypothetical protein PHI27_05605 [Eubacteriales bacterium]|nr:hypothetical protein [Eubacteriales bacterium]MDD3881709.1 hypothetical protein [Eubacteriales bacterium]
MLSGNNETVLLSAADMDFSAERASFQDELRRELMNLVSHDDIVELDDDDFAQLSAAGIGYMPDKNSDLIKDD